MKSTDFKPGVDRISYGGPYTDEKDRAAIDEVLDSGWWTFSEKGRELEQRLAEETMTEYATLTNSGSSALFLMYAALRERGYKGNIIAGGVQFPTSISSMIFNGFVPNYVDVEEKTLCIDADLVEEAINDETVAILAVNIAGNMPNINKLREIANNYDLELLLDNADGFGGEWGGLPVESYFDIAITSFHAAHITCMGEGGALFTSDAFVNGVAQSVREWGRIGDTDKPSSYEDIPSDYPGRYVFKYLGMNIKPLELQCAIGLEQLNKLRKIKFYRSYNYMTLYNGLDGIPQVKLPTIYNYASPSWFSFPMLVNDRADLREFLHSRNIETRTIFGGNITKQPAFRNRGIISTDLTVSDTVMNHGMFISVHPSNTDEMNQYMIESIKDFYA